MDAGYGVKSSAGDEGQKGWRTRERGKWKQWKEVEEYRYIVYLCYGALYIRLAIKMKPSFIFTEPNTQFLTFRSHIFH